MNYKITVNRIIPGGGIEHLFDTGHICDEFKAYEIYDSLLQVYSGGYDVVLTLWEQNINVVKRSQDEWDNDAFEAYS